MLATLSAPVERPDAVATRSMLIATVAFLTLIDLFGAQALLPTLARYFDATPLEVGIAVNASTLGMAASGLALAFFADRIDRRTGIWVSLALLSVPTFLLGFVTDLHAFAALRVCQGVFMAAAFTLTLSYLSSVCTHTAARGAMAAYITGNVASNVFGRLLASGTASSLGLAETFYVFAGLNLLGAAIAYWYFHGVERNPHVAMRKATDIRQILTKPVLLAGFLIGFVILFTFVGVFTYVNFILSEAPFALEQMALGYVYLVFLPSMVTTPFASVFAQRHGTFKSFLVGMLVALGGLVLLLTPSLPLILVALTLIGMGLFFAQAVVTGLIGHAAEGASATANALYLASYYLGGVAGAGALGLVFATSGWHATVGVMATAIVMATLVGSALRPPPRNAVQAAQ